MKFVSGEEAPARNWRDSRRVAGLPVEVPAGVKWASAGAGQHPPAVAKASDLRFFVLMPGRFDRRYKTEPCEKFWEVMPAGFRHFEYKRKEEGLEETRLVVTEALLDQPQRMFQPEPEPGDADSGRGEKEG